MTTDASPIILSADGTQVAIDVSSGAPVVVHWGADVGDANLTLSPHDPGLWRENARGFLGRPALVGDRDGHDWSPKFVVSRVEADANSLTIESVDDAASLSVTATFELAPAGVLTVAQTVTNQGETPYRLHELTTWLPLPAHAAETLDFTGHWGHERQPQRRPIQAGAWSRESREGRPGFDHTIVQLALTEGAGFRAGEVWALGVQWSGNVRQVVERVANGSASSSGTSIGAGELLLPGEVVLGPGETYAAPSVAATWSGAGIDGVSDRLHRWLRARPQHPSSPRPLTLNVWEAVYFDHSLPKLIELADLAASIGVERYVLDDGWFLGRRDDSAGLGDWVVDPVVWPNGLHPLVDHVTGLGMQFGLWFEGEMVNPDSELYREHPEWIFHVGDRVPPESRNQQVLDLGHAGAYEHVLGQVDAILSEYDISYIKWDHNRVLVEPGHLGRAGVRRQTEAIYRLFDELKARHPGLEIESCSSGGGRVDLGMVQHADRFWTSDMTDPIERQGIQRWTGVAIPPEMLGTHVASPESHQTHRTTSLPFRAITALFGHAGIEWDVTSASAADLEHLASWAAYYRANRQLLHSGRVVRTEPHDGALVHGVVAQDASTAIFAYLRLEQHPGVGPQAFRLPGLDRDARYAVRLVEPAGASVPKHRPGWMSGAETTGAALESIGLTPPQLNPQSAFLVEISRV
jgi:alpha-galactosidase